MWSSKGNNKKWMVNGKKLEMLQRKINTTAPQETDQEEHKGVEEGFPDSYELVARAELSIVMNVASEEEIIVVSELKEIYDLGEKVEGIIFQKVDFKRLIQQSEE